MYSLKKCMATAEYVYIKRWITGTKTKEGGGKAVDVFTVLGKSTKMQKVTCFMYS